ncbi:MAG: RNA polymerase sigma factor [Spirochaetes bacterium]|nr:RNA polymerase sigma factor [Spirochaetota bacterium]
MGSHKTGWTAGSREHDTDPLASSLAAKTGETLDEVLAEEAGAGDRGAFERLAWRWWDRIRGFCAAMSGYDADLADEASQDALIRLHKAIKGWKRRSSFGTFLYALCRTSVADAVRRRARRNRGMISLDGEAAPEFPDIRAAPEREVLKHDLETHLAEAMRSLTPEDRVLVYLHEAEGVGLAELGLTFGLPEGTVKSRLFRARARLASIMRDKGYG